MQRSDRQLRQRVLLVGLAATAVVLAAWSAGWMRRPEGGLYDLRAQRFQHFTPRPTDRLVHVDIDDPTLDAVGAWPWPRSVMASLIDEMAHAGTKVIALDVLYTQPQEQQWLPVGDPSLPPASLAARPATVPDATDPATAGLHGSAVGATPPFAPSPLANPPPSTQPRDFVLVDHDANLARAFRRAGNVVMAASLQFKPTRPQTTVMAHAVELLSRSPTLLPDQLVASLAQFGATSAELAEVGATFYSLRREAVQDEIERRLRAREVAGAVAGTASSTPGPGGRPLTAPSSQPSDADATVVRSLAASLFPDRPVPPTSAEYRVVAECYEKARGAVALDRFCRGPAAGVTAFRPRGELPPVPVLIEAADASGFVDYPPLSEGTVRSVPMFVENQGRLFPQMGLRIACKLLDVDIGAVQLEQEAITLPEGTLPDGTHRPSLRVPLRTASRTFESGRRVDFPLIMDIPWFGTRQWESMYDTTQPSLKKQHLPLVAVYAAVRSGDKIRRSAPDADRAARDLLAQLAEFAPEKAASFQQYAQHPLTGQDADQDGRTVEGVFQQAEALNIPRDLKAEAASDPQEKLLASRIAALRDYQSLLNELAANRLELRGKLAGKAALIGWASTWQISDTYPTPLHDAAPGVVVHGVILNALLTGDVWRTVPEWVSGLVALALGVITTLAVARLSPTWSAACAIGLALAYGFVNCFVLFDYGNTIVELAVPLLAVSGAWAGGTITRLVFESRERARITRRFSAWVDPDIVNYFLEVRDETLLSGQQRQTSVVFTDLAGFTTLSEQLGEDVVPLLNDFMGRAVRVIKDHRGVVNKFLGDGILFFFNAPRPNKSYVTDAVESIIGLQRMMVDFNADLAKQKLPQVKLRAGLTTGQVIAGDAGTKERGDYTVIGDLVNLAARLESANKAFGTSNLVTDVTVERSEGKFLFRPIGAITVVGQQTMVRVYETLAYAHEATEEQKTLATVTAKVVDSFAAGDARACLDAVNELTAITGETKLVKVYRQTCEPFVTGKSVGPMPVQISLSEK